MRATALRLSRAPVQAPGRRPSATVQEAVRAANAPPHRQERIRGHVRRIGVRQDDAPEPDWRPRRPFSRHHRRRRRAHLVHDRTRADTISRQQGRLRVPVLQPPPDAHRALENVEAALEIPPLDSSAQSGPALAQHIVDRPKAGHSNPTAKAKKRLTCHERFKSQIESQPFLANRPFLH
jgi:hypothetical protein